jgi:hypothetical protein
MSVDIPDEFRRFVSSLIASDQDLDDRAVVERALWLLQAAHEPRVKLRKDLDHGADQIKSGKCAPASEVIERLRCRAEEIGVRILQCEVIPPKPHPELCNVR